MKFIYHVTENDQCIIYIHRVINLFLSISNDNFGHGGYDHMVVGFTSTYTVSVYQH